MKNFKTHKLFPTPVFHYKLENYQEAIDDYSKLTKELKIYKGSTSIKFRKFMSAKAFGCTAYYDSVISNWFNNQLGIKFPAKKTIHGKLLKNLRYGENPHQKGKLYGLSNNLGFNKLHGKELIV